MPLTTDLRTRPASWATPTFQVGSSRSVVASPSKFSGAVGLISSQLNEEDTAKKSFVWQYYGSLHRKSVTGTDLVDNEKLFCIYINNCNSFQYFVTEWYTIFSSRLTIYHTEFLIIACISFTVTLLKSFEVDSSHMPLSSEVKSSRMWSSRQWSTLGSF